MVGNGFEWIQTVTFFLSIKLQMSGLGVPNAKANHKLAGSVNTSGVPIAGFYCSSNSGGVQYISFLYSGLCSM